MISSSFPTVRISDLSNIIKMEEKGGGEKKRGYIYVYDHRINILTVLLRKKKVWDFVICLCFSVMRVDL